MTKADESTCGSLSHRLAFACISIVGAVASFSGCGTDPATPEDVVSSTEAIGETSCTTVPIPASQISVAPAGCSALTARVTSPDASYNPAGCANALIAQFNGSNYHPFLAGVTWLGQPLNASNCAAARFTVYGWDYTTPPGGPGGAAPPFWTAKGNYVLTGVWSTTENACNFARSGWSGVMTPTAGMYTQAARVAAEATLNGVKQRLAIKAVPTCP